MSCARRASHCLYALLIAAPWPLQAATTLEVGRASGVFHVHVATAVAVDVATAWQVLTDYDHLAEFVPDMHSSRLVSGPGRPRLLRQEGDAGVLVFRRRIEVVLELDEQAPSRLAFRAVGGNMRRMQGEWRVHAADAGVDLEYEAQIEPAFWVPPLIGTALMRGNVRRQVDGVVREMLKRHAADRHGAPGATEDTAKGT